LIPGRCAPHGMVGGSALGEGGQGGRPRDERRVVDARRRSLRLDPHEPAAGRADGVGGVEPEHVVDHGAVGRDGEAAGDVTVGVDCRERVHARLGLSVVRVHAEDRSAESRDVEVVAGERRLEHGLPAGEAERLGLPVADESPHRLESGVVATQLGDRPGEGAPASEAGVEAGLEHHVDVAGGVHEGHRVVREEITRVVFHVLDEGVVEDLRQDPLRGLGRDRRCADVLRGSAPLRPVGALRREPRRRDRCERGERQAGGGDARFSRQARAS